MLVLPPFPLVRSICNPVGNMTHFSILVAIACSLVGFDVWLTRRRMREYGTKIEMNPVIRRLTNKLGIELGLLLGVFIPFCALTLVCQGLGWEDVYAAYTGFRFFLFSMQLRSLRYERDIKRHLAQFGPPRGASLPPSASPSDPTAPTSSQE